MRCSTGIMQVVAMLVMACLVLLMVPHASAVSNQRSEVQAHLEEEGIGEWFGKKWEILQNVASNKYLRFEKPPLQSLKEFRKRASCKSILPDKGTHNMCTADEKLEASLRVEDSRMFQKNGHKGRKRSSAPGAATKSMRSEAWFWADAARLAKLARVAYRKGLKQGSPGYVHILEVFEGYEADADAFVSVRSTASRQFRTLHTKTNIVAKDLLQPPGLEQYRKEELLKWKGMEEEGPPAAVEVVVRGTSSKMDVLIDLYAVKTEFKVSLASDPGKEISYGEVHSGFYKQYEALRDPIRKTLLPFLPAIRSGKTLLYFSGHSLGGAVAQLLAMDIVTHFELKPVPYPKTIYNKDNPFPTISAVRVYTFGAPRVGTAWFARSVAQHTFHVRFKFMGDVVPEVPLKGMGYKHGDTYAIGLAIATGGLRESRSGPSGFYAFCVSECSPISDTIKQIMASHAIEWTYQGSIERMFLSVLDSQEKVFLGPENQVLLSVLEADTNDDDMAKHLLTSMQCRNNPPCIREVQYPGAKPEHYHKCEMKLKKKNIRYDEAAYQQLLSGSGGSKDLVHGAVAYRRKFTTAFDKCMSQYIDESYFDVLQPSDFIIANGDIDRLKRMRLIHVACFSNLHCMRHLNKYDHEYLHLTDKELKECEGDIDCLDRIKESKPAPKKGSASHGSKPIVPPLVK